MNNIETELDRLLTHLLKDVELDQIHLKKELNYFIFNLSSSNRALVLYDLEKRELLFASADISRWLGYEGQWTAEYYKEIVNCPECETRLGQYLVHFNISPEKDFCTDYPFRKKDGTPLLLYGCSRSISFDEYGKAKLIITLFCPIDYMFGICHKNAEVENPAITAEMRERFQSLSPREKEILPQLLNDKTDDEIGAKLNIQPGTIKVHRNSIKNKLKLNTFTGMAMFRVFY